AQVRLMALLALADLRPSPESGKAIAAALADPKNSADRWIPEAATCAAAKNADQFLIALAGQSKPADRALSVAVVVAAHYARAKDESLSGEQRAAAARELIGYRADKETVQTLLDLITPRTPPEMAAGILRAAQDAEVTATGALILERLPGLTPSARKAGVAA